MANIKEHYLNEIKIHSVFLDDVLLAILHTIMFLRAPNNLKAKDRICERLSPLIYATCSPVEVDQNIKGTIDQFKRTFVGTGRNIRGEIVLSFFDRREIKEWIGLVTRTENFYFERWHVPITIFSNPSNPSVAPPSRRHSTGSAEASYGLNRIIEEEECDYPNAYRSAYDQVTKTMMAILESVNSASDHVPLSVYHYELQVGEVSAGAEERRRSASLSVQNNALGTNLNKR